MMPQVIFDDTRDEIVPVVVACMIAQCEALTDLRTRRFEEMRMQLLLQELIREPLIDQDRRA
jgi:hypothetical protein